MTVKNNNGSPRSVQAHPEFPGPSLLRAAHSAFPFLLELDIRLTLRLLVVAHRLVPWANARIKRLVASRSAATVARMEKRRGLA